MANKPTTIAGIVENIISIIAGLRQIDPQLSIHGVTQDTMSNKVLRFNAINVEMAEMDARSVVLMKERNNLLEEFEQFPVVTREVVAGIYTKNSNAYVLVGGTRPDDISRKGGRKAKPPKPENDGNSNG